MYDAAWAVLLILLLSILLYFTFLKFYRIEKDVQISSISNSSSQIPFISPGIKALCYSLELSVKFESFF